MKELNEIDGYAYRSANKDHSHAYLLPTVTGELARFFARADTSSEKRVFDLGCGNGSVANVLVQLGYSVVGVDPSHEGIKQANQHYPHIKLETGSAYEDLAGQYGRFPVVVSLEVVEHVYAPRDYARTLASLVEPGGMAIVSTPYHGYLKNLALAATGKLDAHFTALWDHGHIKFWSRDTLGQLLGDAGFDSVRFRRVGRFAPLAKSMVAIARA